MSGWQLAFAGITRAFKCNTPFRALLTLGATRCAICADLGIAAASAAELRLLWLEVGLEMRMGVAEPLATALIGFVASTGRSLTATSSSFGVGNGW